MASILSSPGDIYARLLFHKGQGYPMFFPEPNECLSEKYRELGARIGDVGIIAEDGSFDYLFNICRPADHPINLNRTPCGFKYVPLRQDHDMRINEDAHAPNSYIASTTVERTVFEAGVSTGGNQVVPAGVDARVQYTSSGLKGAMVELSNGATRFDLRNKKKIRQLAMECGASWYEFANVDLGRMATNGSLYIVTGCDKSNTFQLASWSRKSNQPRVSVTFAAAQQEEGRVSYSYSNETSSPATVRVGPREPSQKQNQCIFLRGFKIAIRGNNMAKIFGQTSLTSIIGARRSQIIPRTVGGSIPFDVIDSWRFPSSTGSSIGRSSSRSSTASSTSSDDFWDSSDDESDSTCDDDVGVDLLRTLPTPYHPSNAILDWLLDSVPSAQVVLADDDVWMNVLEKDDTEMPNDDELIRRVSNMYTPALQSGGSYLVPIVDRQSPVLQETTDIVNVNEKAESMMPSETLDEKMEYPTNTISQGKVSLQDGSADTNRGYQCFDPHSGDSSTGCLDQCDNARFGSTAAGLDFSEKIGESQLRDPASCVRPSSTAKEDYVAAWVHQTADATLADPVGRTPLEIDTDAYSSPRIRTNREIFPRFFSPYHSLRSPSLSPRVVCPPLTNTGDTGVIIPPDGRKVDGNGQRTSVWVERRRRQVDGNDQHGISWVNSPLSLLSQSRPVPRRCLHQHNMGLTDIPRSQYLQPDVNVKRAENRVSIDDEDDSRVLPRFSTATLLSLSFNSFGRSSYSPPNKEQREALLHSVSFSQSCRSKNAMSSGPRCKASETTISTDAPKSTMADDIYSPGRATHKILNCPLFSDGVENECMPFDDDLIEVLSLLGNSFSHDPFFDTIHSTTRPSFSTPSDSNFSPSWIANYPVPKGQAASRQIEALSSTDCRKSIMFPGYRYASEYAVISKDVPRSSAAGDNYSPGHTSYISPIWGEIENEWMALNADGVLRLDTLDDAFKRIVFLTNFHDCPWALDPITLDNELLAPDEDRIVHISRDHFESLDGYFWSVAFSLHDERMGSSLRSHELEMWVDQSDASLCEGHFIWCPACFLSLTPPRCLCLPISFYSRCRQRLKSSRLILPPHRDT